AGRWSLTNWRLIYRNPPQAQLTRLEYFLDADPGFGNGTPIAITPSQQIVDLSQNVDLSTLAEGFHRLAIRSKDAEGRWSLTNWRLIYRNPPQAQLTRLEYFLDADPGFGNGTPIAITPSQQVVDLSQSIDLSTLAEGFHRLAIRSKNVEGHWSLTNWRYLYRAPGASPDLVKLEYFFDTDPGFGNGTQVSFPAPSSEIIDFIFPPSTQGVSPGVQNFYVRVWDGSHWSMTGALNVTVNQVFPVEWLYFEAIPGEIQVQLEWGTALERNTDHFVLERSSDGRAFMPLSRVPAQGDADTPTYYTYDDADPLSGLNYYRIKQVDLDGSFNLSEIRQAHFTQLPAIKVYPNPSQGKIYVSGLSEDTQIRITDGRGKEIAVPAQRHHSTYEAQLEALPPGIYQVIIENQQQQQSYRILKL
ncbi:MAG: T9SS type A sorting domain-containing protein, partial [Bacteroidota bacterium]